MCVCVSLSLYIYMQRGVEEKPKSAMYQRNIPVSIKPAQPTKQGFSTNVQLNNHFVFIYNDKQALSYQLYPATGANFGLGPTLTNSPFMHS